MLGLLASVHSPHSLLLLQTSPRILTPRRPHCTMYCRISPCTACTARTAGPLERYVYEETNRKLIEEFRRPGAADALADAAARLVASSGKPAACTHGKLGATATSLLSLYTKLRQSCCHPQVCAVRVRYGRLRSTGGWLQYMHYVMCHKFATHAHMCLAPHIVHV